MSGGPKSDFNWWQIQLRLVAIKPVCCRAPRCCEAAAASMRSVTKQFLCKPYCNTLNAGASARRAATTAPAT